MLKVHFFIIWLFLAWHCVNCAKRVPTKVSTTRKVFKPNYFRIPFDYDPNRRELFMDKKRDLSPDEIIRYDSECQPAGEECSFAQECCSYLCFKRTKRCVY